VLAVELHHRGLPARGGVTVTVVYGSSPVKRERRTNDQLAVLDDAIVAAVELEAPVTLRGVYYRCVSAGAIDKTENGYKTVGRRLLKLRREGRVSYWDITDGTRWIFKPTTFDSVEDALEETARTYRRALWSTSVHRLQMFVEKDAISGVILPTTRKWDVALGVLRGYASESFAWTVAQSLVPDRYNVLAQLGDHDPSGVDAWRDFSSKVTAFAEERNADVDVRFVRLAVTEEQIVALDLPTRPTKKSDTRTNNWTGGESVEVDAISANYLRDLVDAHISYYVNERHLEVLKAYEVDEREQLRRLARWEVA
jgi:hypothetical protein